MTSARTTLEKSQPSAARAEAPGAERQRKLKQLLGELETQLTELSRTHGEQAQSIGGFARLAAHEATRTEQNPRLLKPALEGLRASVAEFEASHPQLVQTVGAISTLLAGMGI